jgi:hypothetical protein
VDILLVKLKLIGLILDHILKTMVKKGLAGSGAASGIGNFKLWNLFFYQ